jgi:hypothetical protein
LEAVRNLHRFSAMKAMKTEMEPLPDIDFSEEEEGDEVRREPLPFQIRVEPRPRLPFGVRVGIFILGWLLILVGIAGLILPGIQGVVTIVAGAALLSLDNELAYKGLRRILARWPQLWRRVESFREKAHDRLHKMFHRK